jgi:Tol biopolymer transport system component
MMVRSIVVLSIVLTVAGCGSNGATKATDSNRDRLEITFADAGRRDSNAFLIASMDLFQITKDGRLATAFVSTPNIERHPQWSNDGKKLVFTSTTPGFGTSLWVADADLTGLRQLVADPNEDESAYYIKQ